MEDSKRIRIRVWESGDRTTVGRYVDHEVEVTVDWIELAKHLGTRAVRNRTGRSRLAAGVKVQAIR